MPRNWQASPIGAIRPCKGKSKNVKYIYTDKNLIYFKSWLKEALSCPSLFMVQLCESWKWVMELAWMVDSLTPKEYFWTSGVESSEPVLVVILLLSKRMDRHPTSLFHHYEVSWIRDQCVCVDGCCVAECFAGISIRSSATGIRTSGISVIQSSFVHS